MALDNSSPEYETFLVAVTNGRTAEVEQHLAKHPEFLDLPSNYKIPPLHYAAKNGHESTVELLLNRGSTSIDSTNIFGWSSLHLAARNGHDSTVELLLNRGSGAIDFPNVYGKTPLHLAAKYGHDSTVVLLLSFLSFGPFGPSFGSVRSGGQQGSTSIDSPATCDGTTPLHVAALNDHDSTVTILKAVGAITLSLAGLSQEQIAKLQAPIPEDEILEIRYRIYFSRSLLAQLLF